MYSRDQPIITIENDLYVQNVELIILLRHHFSSNNYPSKA